MTIQQSLVGTWRADHLFTLTQSRDLYRMYQQQIVECDREVETVLSRFEPRVDPAEKPLPPDQKRRHAHKRRKADGQAASALDLRTEAYKLFGVDVTQIPGLETMVSPLFSETSRLIDSSEDWTCLEEVPQEFGGHGGVGRRGNFRSQLEDGP